MSKVKVNEYCNAGIENLRNAIIEFAAKDYKAALKRKDKNGLNGTMNLERYFLSDGYKSLTTIDGSYLIRELRAMIHDELVAEKKDKIKKAKKELAKKKKNKVPYRNLFRRIQNLSATIRWIEELEDPG